MADKIQLIMNLLDKVLFIATKKQPCPAVQLAGFVFCDVMDLGFVLFALGLVACLLAWWLALLVFYLSLLFCIILRVNW